MGLSSEARAPKASSRVSDDLDTMTTPAELYRNAIDLNRFSNSVARQIARTYNDLILDAVDQLRGIDELAAPVKAARLRAILAQLKGSLDNWAEASTLLAVEELQGLAVLQSEFVTSELAKALPGWEFIN